MKTNCNGYEIKYNSFWKKWQVWHSEIGFVAEYKKLKDAVLDCLKG